MSLLQRLGLAAPEQRAARSSEPAATGPLLSRSSADARTAHQGNPYTVWSARAYPANQADRSLACHRIWTDHPALGVRPKFTIGRDEPVFAMGSCFAREVEDALVDLGFDVPTHCDALFSDPLLARPSTAEPTLRPRSYLNRYNSMSMLAEFRHLLGQAPEIESGAMSFGLDRGATAELHYSQALRQTNLEQTLARRRMVREFLAPQLRRSRLIVLTLGLAECWFDRETGSYLNNTPGPRVLAAYAGRLEVHLTRFSQNLQALEDLHRVLVGAIGNDIKLVVTVSPVPLERTFLDADVVVSNHYAKSMLRAVAQEFAASHANVDYFPSYEVVSYANPSRSWAWDHRHVAPDLVAHVMQLFRQHYVDGAATSAPDAPLA